MGEMVEMVTVALLLFFSGLVLGWSSHSDPRPVAFPAVPELAARCARHKARAPKIPRANPNHPGTSHPPVGNYWYSYETLEKKCLELKDRKTPQVNFFQ